MKLVKMIREVPEIPNTPTETEVQLQDIPALEARGWTVSGDSYESGDGNEKNEAPAGDAEGEKDGESGDGNEKGNLLQQAIALKIGSPSTLARMSVSKLKSLIDGAKE